MAAPSMPKLWAVSMAYVESVPSRFSSRQSSLEPTSYTGSSYYSSDVRELRRQLRQLEDKYKEVMVVNAQLDGDKQLLR
ncbi:unnamed protein product [Dibothriocephalus latus]|uniref:Uncharacterized protein n=1 Tax=Dibothriocephalus latus TaxID=60516 RepID=A0A3P6Q2F6_DIBLA|nr:unnamed protein product [Dibothriocephalus latus]